MSDSLIAALTMGWAGGALAWFLIQLRGMRQDMIFHRWLGEHLDELIAALERQDNEEVDRLVDEMERAMPWRRFR